MAPGTSKYLITNPSKSNTLRFPLPLGVPSIGVSGVYGAALVPLHVMTSDLVIVHGMGLHGATGFLFSPRKAARVWSGWGFDYYGDDLDSNAGLISPSTAELMSSINSRHKTATSIRNFKKQLFSLSIKASANITDYFSAPISSDFEIFKSRFKNFSGDYCQLNYGSVEHTFSQGSTISNGDNILVGNSASETNNHIDIFQSLALQDLGSRKVIVPLSYGDPNYRRKLVAAGNSMLGKNFFPLENFLPLDEYSSIISSCNIVVMNHVRQQALGNIGTALYQGAHVYLDPKNPVYKFFKEKNTLIHTTLELASNPLPYGGLSPAQVQENRSILQDLWGYENIKSNVNNLINKVRAR